MLFRTLALAATAQALLPIVTFGNKFYTVDEDYNKPGKEFKIVGVDYQPGGSSSFQVNGKSDVLSDGQVCLRDAYALQQLGVNTIRVYSVSPWLNHDECMSIFNAAGIYVLLDLNNPYQSLHRENTGDSYNSDLLNNVFGLIDAFKLYPNTLGFFSGNEIINDGPSAQSAPKYIRALQRDIKDYISLHANRTIPVGYSAADDVTLRVAVWEYLQCGNDTSRSDFYGINSYEWCSGSSDWVSSGYQALKDTFDNSSIAVFFSEYGCNKNQPRTFDEVTDGVYKKGDQGLYDTLTGGIIYEYSNEDNNYGLVDLKSDGTVQYRDDFDNLKKRFSQIQLDNATQPSQIENQPPACNSDLIKGTDFDFDLDLPDCPDKDALKNGGGNNNIGKLVDISGIQAKYSILDKDGNKQDGKVSFASNGTNWQYNVPKRNNSESASSDNSSSSASASSSAEASATSSAATSSKKKNDAGLATVGSWSVSAALFAALFAYL